LRSVQAVRMGGLFNVSLTANQRQEIERGQAALNRRRAEFVYMANGSRTQENRPEAPEITRPTLEACTEYKCSEYPQQVSFYTLMGVHAARRYSGSGGAWRAYVLAKGLDVKGYGRISLDDLRGFALHLGVNLRTFQRWIKQATKRGMLQKFKRENGETWLYLPNPAKVAHAMHCDGIGRKLEIKAALLIGKGWKSRVWDGAQAAGADGKQISRERLQKVFNVPVRTQRYRTAQAETKCQANYANLGIKVKPSQLKHWEENSSYKGLFIAGNGYLFTRLPDTRSTELVIDIGKGRGKKATAKLRELQNQDYSLNMQREQGNDSETEYIRLFCNTPKQLEASEKKAARQDVFTVTEIFQRWYEAKSGAAIWEAHVQGEQV
jgi:hypothetical protein